MRKMQPDNRRPALGCAYLMVGDASFAVGRALDGRAIPLRQVLTLALPFTIRFVAQPTRTEKKGIRSRTSCSST